MNWKASSNSQLWSISKQKWISGPSYPKGFYALNSCALALNSTAVIVIGLIPTNDFDSFHSDEDIGLLQNTATVIYNFQSNKWIQQESLVYANTVHGYTYDFTCHIVQEKSQKR